MAPRARKYKKHSEAVINQVLQSEEPYEVGKILGIPKSTVATILRRGGLPKQRGGKTNVKLDDVHETFLIRKIEEKPDLTLKELADFLFSEYRVRVTPQTVSRHLDGLLFTLKDLRVEVDSVNNETNRRKRKEWSLKYLHG